MKEGTLFFNKETGEPAFFLIGYTDKEIEEYIEGRIEVGTGNLGVFRVKYFENPRNGKVVEIEGKKYKLVEM